MTNPGCWFAKKEATSLVLNLTASPGDNQGINI